MRMFIEVTQSDGSKVLINLMQIAYVEKSDSSNKDFQTSLVLADTTELEIAEPYTDVKGKIEDALKYSY